MGQGEGVGREEEWEARVLEFFGRRWLLVNVLFWVCFCVWMIFEHWGQIRSFGLGDTDDNMRIMQVRALLQGQGWYDLRNYRMNPPFGANIHWSRLVDLPIAGLILMLRPFLGGAAAERWAVAIEPMLPYLLLLISLTLTARRLLGPTAYLLAFCAILVAGSTNSMFAPDRIDHHGWQLAFLALSLAAIADPDKARGGLILGISSALSLAVGLEMIIYLAVAGVAMVLFFVEHSSERERLRSYAISLGAGTALCFLIFASNDNWSGVCDALSPVWLSDALVASVLMFALSSVPATTWQRRLILALGAGLVIAAFHVLTWPQCLKRPEGISPEVERLWLSHVKEARPVWTHGWRTATLMSVLPVTGAVGWSLIIWWRWSEPDVRRRVTGTALPAIAASLLLLWQTRTDPAAQMMAVVGAAAIAWLFLRKAWSSSSAFVRVFGASMLILLGSGAAIPMIVALIPAGTIGVRSKEVEVADTSCGTLSGLHAVALQPRGVVMTFVDLGPRLITVTHHDAIAGPYHRNGQQIADVMNFWRGSADRAHRLAHKYHASYVLSCPNSSESTIFVSETPRGFYGQLQRGEVPGWLSPVQLAKDSPYRMWKVVD